MSGSTGYLISENENEQKLMQECQKEELWQRSIPMSVLGGLSSGAYYGIKPIIPGGLKIVVGAIIGYGLGKWRHVHRNHPCPATQETPNCKQIAIFFEKM